MTFKTHVLQRLFRYAHALCVGYSLEGKGKGHVFKGSIVWHKVECLKYEAHVFLAEKYKLALVHALQMLAVYHHLARCGRLKACEKVQQGGFAAAAAAYYAAEFPRHYLKVHSPEGMNIHAAYTVYLFCVPDAYYWLLLHWFLRY